MDWKVFVKERMQEKGITQDDLAERLEVTQGGLGHWLNGRREPPISKLIEIADILDVDRGQLGALVMEADNSLFIASNLFEKDILKISRKIPPSEQDRFLGYIEAKIEVILQGKAAEERSNLGATSLPRKSKTL